MTTGAAACTNHSVADRSPSQRKRSGKVLTKLPTKGSSSRRVRPETGVPTTTSAWPPLRAKTKAQAETNTV
jgi:hypothetical protein